MKTTNQKIACVPVARDFKPELKNESGFGRMEQRTELIELKVLLDSSSGYNTGDLIYVNGGNLDRSEWAKTKLSFEGIVLILVPESEIVITNKGD